MPEEPGGWERDRKAKEAVLGKQGKSLAELRDAYEKAKEDLRGAMERHSPGATALESYREEVQRTKKEYEAARRHDFSPIKTGALLVRLTPAENRVWVKYFTYYLDEGWTEEGADEQTWEDLQSEFPRLKEYDGIVPDQKETRRCEHPGCDRTLPKSEMSQGSGGEWFCREHALADLETQAEGIFEKSLTGAQVMEAIMNAVEHVEREGYYAFDSEEFAQSVMNALGPKGHTVRMGPHEGKWVVEVMIGTPLRWPRMMPMTDLPRAFEEKGPMKRWIAAYDVVVGDKELVARAVIEAPNKKVAWKLAEMNGLINTHYDMPNAGWKLQTIDTIDTVYAYDEIGIRHHVMGIAENLDVEATFEAVKEAIKKEWGL